VAVLVRTGYPKVAVLLTGEGYKHWFPVSRVRLFLRAFIPQQVESFRVFLAIANIVLLTTIVLA